MSELANEMSALAGQFTTVNTIVSVPAGASGVQLCQRNPLRWGLRITYDGQVTGQVQLATNPTLPNTDGWQMTAGTPLDLTFRQHPGLTTAAWYAGNSGGAAVAVLVTEEIAVQ